MNIEITTIALIACVKDKKSFPAKAKEMYSGENFREWYQDAIRRNVDHIYVLSGKYGLLEPDSVIEPYDFNLNSTSDSHRKEWATGVIQQLKKKHDLERDHFVIYSNQKYAEFLIKNLKSYEMPFDIQ